MVRRLSSLLVLLVLSGGCSDPTKNDPSDPNPRDTEFDNGSGIEAQTLTEI